MNVCLLLLQRSSADGTTVMMRERRSMLVISQTVCLVDIRFLLIKSKPFPSVIPEKRIGTCLALACAFVAYESPFIVSNWTLEGGRHTP